jgi:hypothetical protein
MSRTFEKLILSVLGRARKCLHNRAHKATFILSIGQALLASDWEICTRRFI